MSPSLFSRPEIRTVLSTLTWPTAEIARVQSALGPSVEFIQCSRSDTSTIASSLPRAQVALLAGDLNDSVLESRELKWVHCDHAGLNHSARPEVFERGLFVTGSAGRSGPALAQHAFFFAQCFVYDVRKMLQRQEQNVWGTGEEIEQYRERGALWGKKLGVVGYGYTGKEMAKIGRAMGMHVTILRRSHGEGEKDENVDVMLSTEAGQGIADGILAADFIMLSCSLSDSTYHLFSTPEFERMKHSCVIINLARGAVIDEPALIAALKQGEIAGAGLDVFEQEPLGKDSELWNMSNVLITPHATPQMPDKIERSVAVVLENIAKYRRGEGLLNALDERDLYTKGAVPN
ncbi:D-isomer-specific 2-hydroxyacid dehydrogenase NAD-binding protein [Dacryopinax primogenitus]|uniref:D-isomer-specific 2-hydroxyacid dehydrogenase NAD-binding protein n=1 Tax=Dacryopinax primogenitus (strain DJM 731) TaxID=1858805 RepID=M5FUX3_DACPD|nr:D-isomer-specific 2-hydroxyacid dehydrogenase NAD-binding protein [Dacryopinax primogenitus]EJT97081.1 D-isomer-specific 2-hydroxyacid dehydrogenase NAD-binding protein [Dacryopinax primogenitus]